MSRTHILLIFLLLPLTLRSQEDICIGKELVLYSTVLQEDRSYWINLPEHYNMDTKPGCCPNTAHLPPPSL